jgi:hypothetical protein
MADIVAIDTREIQITPFFRVMEIENIPKSETAGYAVMETHEMVEIRKAGDRHNILIAPADGFWKREGGKVMTYLDRWPDQYRQFKDGNPQEAQGTPLEALKRHGVTDEQISLCRVMRVYSVEALHQLEGQGLKSLGTHQNKLKQAAATHMADRTQNIDALDRIKALEAELTALRSQGAMVIPAVEPDLTDDQMKEEIAKLAGQRPRGNPSTDTLKTMLNDLRAA